MKASAIWAVVLVLGVGQAWADDLRRHELPDVFTIAPSSAGMLLRIMPSQEIVINAAGSTTISRPSCDEGWTLVMRPNEQGISRLTYHGH